MKKKYDLQEMKDNLIIYVSSRNNYDMLEHEVLKNIKLEGFEFINIDDKSSDAEIAKGKSICKKHDIVFLENKSRGVQMATQTLIDWINKNRPKCKWIICFQHDNWPLTKDFFTRLSNLIATNKLDDFGTMGFNVLAPNYTPKELAEFKNGNKVIGQVGIANLSVHNLVQRWLCPDKNVNLSSNREKWLTPFIIESPLWAVGGINIEWWNNYIEPTTEYQFHLWFPDIAMQLNYVNKPCIILPDLYIMNVTSLKEKYGIPGNSAAGAMSGDEYHFGTYNLHHNSWKARFGWDYEHPWDTYQNVADRYEGTLISEYWNHDISKGPLKTFDLGEY